MPDEPRPPGGADDPIIAHFNLAHGVDREFARKGYKLVEISLRYEGLERIVSVPANPPMTIAEDDELHPIEEVVVAYFRRIGPTAPPKKGIEIANGVDIAYDTIRKHLANLLRMRVLSKPERSGYLRGEKFPQP